MGTVFQIPWTILDETVSWPEGGLRLLRNFGYKTVSMALRDDSVSISDPRLKQEARLAIILGTEGDGLASATIEGCDYTVRIPMSHGVDLSLIHIWASTSGRRKKHFLHSLKFWK